MGYTLPFFFTLLLFNGCLSEATSNNTSVASTHNGRHRTTLLDVFDEVLYLIFMELDLVEWSNMAEIHSIFASVANDAYRTRYQNYPVNIYGTDVDGDPDKPQHRGKFDNEISYANDVALWLYDYRLVLNVFKYFSSNIRTLQITTGVSIAIDGDRFKAVNQFVNKYTTPYVTDIEFAVANGALEQYTNPFSSVKNLKCEVNADEIGANVLPFNELFPNLTQLEITLFSEAAYNLIDWEFSQLDDVKISLLDIPMDDNKTKQTEKFVSFLKKNQRIKAFEIYYFDWNYVEYISEHLQNLQNLTLNIHDFNVNNRITFESVTNLRLLDSFREYPTVLSFPRLQYMNFYYSADFSEEWKRFFGNHQTLKKLELIERSYFGCYQLASLTENLTNLVEVDLHCYKLIPALMMDRFIENHPSLMKIKMEVNSQWYSSRESEIEHLKQRFGAEWHLDFSSNYNFIFERKNATVVE